MGNKKTSLLGWFRPDFRDDVERHCVCVCRAKINLQIPTYTYGVKYTGGKHSRLTVDSVGHAGVDRDPTLVSAHWRRPHNAEDAVAGWRPNIVLFSCRKHG